MADTEGKRLTELRVIDLKNELERRGLDKTGNKAALLDRLSKVIADEGHNPDEYLIVPNAVINKPARKISGTGLQNQDEQMDTSDIQKENSECQDAAEESAAETEEVVVNAEVDKSTKEEAQDEEEEEEEEEEENDDQSVSKDETKMETEEDDSEVKEKEDVKTEVTAKEEKNITNNKEPQNSESTAAAAAETNGIDNEDSINLTIGEDEENLLAEETETQDRQKDGGVGERKRTQDNKKGDSKGSGRADGSTSNKDGTSGASAGTKSKDAGDGGKSGDSNSKGQKRDDKDKKSSQNSSNASSRNLWVSGLSSTTRATDLKQIFSKYGKVIGAKVVTNARTPGARCYGYVTMSTSEDASKCISHLHRTELHGRFISVEKAKGDSQQSHMRKRDSNSGKSEKPKEDKDKSIKDIHQETVEKKDSKEEKKKESEEKEPGVKKIDEKTETLEEKKIEKDVDKKDEKEKDSDARSTKSTSKKPESERGRRDEKRVRSFDRHRSHSRSRSRERRRRDDVLTFAKIREERDRQRLRERERLLREEERRRREDMERQREVERRQREEAARLEREREKLRRERERIEQEKAELLRLERERQKLEREKLERERLELKRQQLRLEESRRAPPPPTIKRSSSDRRDPRDLYVEPERKRLTTEHGRRHSPERVPERRTDIMDRVSERRMETSPSARYDANRSTQDIGLKKDFKRGSDFSSRTSRPEAFTDVSRGREVIVRREPLPTQTPTIDPRQVKERYERPSAANYGRDRDVRRSDPESHRSSRDAHGGRYNESSKPPGSNAPRDSRYVDNNRPGGWHSGPPSAKSFNSVPSGGARDPRNESSGWSGRSSDNVNRWGNSNSMGNALRHPGPPMYQGGPMQSMGMSAPGAPTSYDRFDPYKGSMPMRKY